MDTTTSIVVIAMVEIQTVAMVEIQAVVVVEIQTVAMVEIQAVVVEEIQTVAMVEALVLPIMVTVIAVRLDRHLDKNNLMGDLAVSLIIYL